MNTGPRPMRSAIEALAVARRFVGSGTYKLGALDQDGDHNVFDCFSFVVRFCYGLPGHRPNFNRGWHVDAQVPEWTPTVVDDLNSNSAIEDAFHARELFELVTGTPQLGDILAYPTIDKIRGAGPWVGHAAMVSDVSKLIKASWRPDRPVFSMLGMIECHGPDDAHPAIREATGYVFDRRSDIWPKPQHRSYLLRVKP